MKNETEHCDYCGTPKSDTKKKKLIKGKSSAICIDCIETCSLILQSEDVKTMADSPLNLDLTEKTPQAIIKHLNKFVIGQDKAKIAVATSLYNHYKRVNLNDPNIQKSDILITGPSGSGKTLIGSTAAKILNIPFYSVDISKFSEVGYQGDDVDSILTGLYLAAGEDIQAAETGIVWLDEIDKISDTKSGSASVGKRSVQEELLKMIEGGEFYIATSMNKRNDRENKIKINTQNILFICSGAFEGVYDIVKKRTKNKSSMGFGSEAFVKKDDDYDLLDLLEDKDFIEYGLAKEFVGRLPLKTYVNKLRVEDMVNILIEPENSIIKSYQRLLAVDNIDLEFTKEAIDMIAEKAIAKNIGARGLKSVLESILMPIMFEAPILSVDEGISKIIIDDKYVNSERDDFIKIKDSDNKSKLKNH